MKPRIFLMLMIITLFVFSRYVSAENLDSSNFKLVDPELGSNSGSSQSSNFQVLSLMGTGISMEQFSSSLYKIGSGQGYTFMANTPKLSCFETNTTSGTTLCSSLPRSNGMVGECGETGCYDRAMAQLDVQGNPNGTVFSIQISSDNWTTIYVVDGTTRTLKPIASKVAADYLTKSQWESSPWNHYNIIGLQPNTIYKARATAMHGNFTESAPGASRTATTSMPAITFDLDIGTNFASETAAPYSANIGNLTPETAAFNTSQKVKIDISTNVQSGVTVYVQDQYSGLRSVSTSYSLQSASEDLSNAASADGFGLQTSGTTQDASSAGYSVVGSTYDVAGGNVGAVSSSVATKILCTLTSSGSNCTSGTPTWVTGGSGIYTLGARASLSAPAKSDYQDTLTFTVTGGW